ncbi:hypothetical protein PT300_01865 [Enterobacteriaceae bacterium ESL0689]|nr:hypothetical protein [Enterobacteriaceae bacterium ESL0689]
MRELCNNEIKIVSGAGIVTDNPDFQAAMNSYDNGCNSLATQYPDLAPAISGANQIMHGVASIIDSAFTNAWKNILQLLG